MTQRVCIAGATGYLGIAVTEELCKRGIAVIAVARNSSSQNIAKIRSLGANVEFVDASKPEESYKDSLAGATTAISCLAAGIKNVDKSSDFWAIDRDATVRFGQQAVEAGVKQLILVSTFEGKESRGMSEFSNAKEEAVDALRDKCQEKGIVFTVIRPNAYFKDLTTQSFENVANDGYYTVLGDGSHRINPIAREDVASFMVDCVQSKRGGEHYLGGPDTFTFLEIGILASQVVGNEEQVKTRHVPLWMLRILAIGLSFVGLFSRASRRSAALLNWMVYVSSHDGIAPCCGTRRLIDEYQQMYEEFKQRR
jgi:divinyl chlorophyllide a 8-vinyl-reductase